MKSGWEGLPGGPLPPCPNQPIPTPRVTATSHTTEYTAPDSARKTRPVVLEEGPVCSMWVLGRGTWVMGLWHMLGLAYVVVEEGPARRVYEQGILMVGHSVWVLGKGMHASLRKGPSEESREVPALLCLEMALWAIMHKHIPVFINCQAALRGP